MDGILCMNKPEGFTSFDVVAKLRGITRTKRIGHAGTLDPMATGVLPVFLGRATKAISLLPDHTKRYTAGFQLGLTSDTLDSTGTILSRSHLTLTQQELLAALEQYRGTISQIPPMYSALKVEGKRLYELARQGKTVERKPRKVEIFQLELLSFDTKLQTGVLDVGCSSGTYIRTLCDDIGRDLGVGAVMTSLQRTEAAGFSLADSRTFDEVQQLKDDGRLEEALLPVERVFESYPRLCFGEAQARMFCNGVKLDLDRVSGVESGLHAVYNQTGQFLGLAQPDHDTGVLRIQKLFV
jgi:tRNA pseudouridine55 synthase